MLLLFVVLAGPMLLASSIPALLQVFLEHTIVHQLPGNGFFFGLLGILVSLCLSWVLFEAIYLVVPNQRIGFRKSWLGAVVAAVLLQIFLPLFPPSLTPLFKRYIGATGLVVILLFFFFYFPVIFPFGADFHAFFSRSTRAHP